MISYQGISEEWSPGNLRSLLVVPVRLLKIKQLIRVLKPSSCPVETVAEPFFLTVSLCTKIVAEEVAAVWGCQALSPINLVKAQALAVTQQMMILQRPIKERAGLHQLY